MSINEECTVSKEKETVEESLSSQEEQERISGAAVDANDDEALGTTADEPTADGPAVEEGAADEDAEDAAVPEADQKREFTEEELDMVADTAIETLRGILSFFDAGDAAIDEYEGEDGELILDVVDADLAVLIGRYGKTLDALQFLVASIVNKKIGFRYPIIVDIEGYRHRRRQKLESVAKSSAARCIRNKTDVCLRPMTPYERRIIHIILRTESRVYTESEGEEPNRYVVVKPNKR